jgi:hypothetical protein
MRFLFRAIMEKKEFGGNSVPVEISINDIVRMRKPHPCGGYEWRVVRLGADIGIKCLTCGRRVLLPRGEFERRLKAVIGQSVISDQSTD